MARLWLFFILLLTTPAAFSAITITGVSGGSYTEQDGTSTNFILYGGLVGGPGPACVGDGSSTCNSCTNTGTGPTNIKACNLQSIYGSMQISVTFTASTVASGGSTVRVFTEAAGGTGNASDVSSVTGSIASAGTYSVSLTWGYLCENDQNFGNNSCTPANASTPETVFQNTSRKIYVWVDENGDGTRDEAEKKSVDVRIHYINLNDPNIHKQTFCTAPDGNASGQCGFKLAVGDSKLYLDAVYGATSGGVPAQTNGAPAWYGVALFAASMTVANISNSTVTPQIREYNASGEINDGTVTGLNNYTEYCVLMANINKAQNIYKFNNDGALDPLQVCATPSEVVGMLSDKSCFISTAAFGSDMEKHVQLLREFRNQFLLTNTVGTGFVKLYYKLSPPIAHVIAQSEILKALTRSVLYPFVGMAWLALHYGGWVILVFLGAVASGLYMILRSRREALDL